MFAPFFTRDPACGWSAPRARLPHPVQSGGPLTNPAGARYHVNGVFAAERCEFMARAHAQLGSLRALVVHGAGGLDEIAPSGATQVAELRDGTIRCYEIRPADLICLNRSSGPGRWRRPRPTRVSCRPRWPARLGRFGWLRFWQRLPVSMWWVRRPTCGLALARQEAALDNGGARAVVEHLRRLSPVQKKE